MTNRVLKVNIAMTNSTTLQQHNRSVEPPRQREFSKSELPVCVSGECSRGAYQNKTSLEYIIPCQERRIIQSEYEFQEQAYCDFFFMFLYF